MEFDESIKGLLLLTRVMFPLRVAHPSNANTPLRNALRYLKSELLMISGSVTVVVFFPAGKSRKVIKYLAMILFEKVILQAFLNILSLRKVMPNTSFSELIPYPIFVCAVLDAIVVHVKGAFLECITPSQPFFECFQRRFLLLLSDFFLFWALPACTI